MNNFGFTLNKKIPDRKNELNLYDIQQLVKKIKTEIDKSSNLKWPIFALFTDLLEEIGELAECIKAIEGFKSYKKVSINSIGNEISDLLFSLITIANHYDINLQDVFLDTMREYELRFYNRR